MALDESDAAVEVPPRARGATPLDASVVSHLVGYRLSRAAVPARRVFQHHIGAPLGLRPVEFSLLMLLLAHDRASPSQLALTLDVTPPKITALVDRLAERGLVRRQRSAADGRAFDVLLTPEGRALVRRAQRIAQTMEDGWLADALSPAERAMLLELLGKLAHT